MFITDGIPVEQEDTPVVSADIDNPDFGFDPVEEWTVLIPPPIDLGEELPVFVPDDDPVLVDTGNGLLYDVIHWYESQGDWSPITLEALVQAYMTISDNPDNYPDPTLDMFQELYHDLLSPVIVDPIPNDPVVLPPVDMDQYPDASMVSVPQDILNFFQKQSEIPPMPELQLAYKVITENAGNYPAPEWYVMQAVINGIRDGASWNDLVNNNNISTIDDYIQSIQTGIGDAETGFNELLNFQAIINSSIESRDTPENMDLAITGFRHALEEISSHLDVWTPTLVSDDPVLIKEMFHQIDPTLIL